MNAPIDTLVFAKSFEDAGFAQDQARALAAAFARAQEIGREDLVTKTDLDLRLTEFEARFNRSMGDLESRLSRSLGDLEVRLTRQIGDVGKDLSGRLWSTVTIIAGVSTAISAVVGAAVALLLHAKVM